jgi:hypothetical protein
VVCAVLLAGMAAMVTPVFAEDPKPAGLNPDDLKKALGLSIYLQGGYTYNGDASRMLPATRVRKIICGFSTTRRTVSPWIWRRSCSARIPQSARPAIS